MGTGKVVECTYLAGLRVPDPYPHQRIEVFLIPKNVAKKLSKHDQGCSSRIPGPDLDFLPTGSRIPTATLPTRLKYLLWWDVLGVGTYQTEASAVWECLVL